MMSDNIQVAIRMRPLIKRERDVNASVHWKADGSSVVQENQPSNKFQFDRVFREIDTNEIVYTEFCSSLVESVINGFNGTIFAYGQTSSGKTFTMMGKDDGMELGIAHYTIYDIFNHIQEIQKRSERDFLLKVSYMEIYNESIFDLLSDKSKDLKLIDRDGIKVGGLSEHYVQTSEQVMEYMRKGEKNRRIGHTQMNERSSRSHSIFQVIIESGIRGDKDSAVKVSQFNLVDLAGSERVAQTGARETRLTESKYINLSLLTLSQVIRQLSEKQVFINYRDSKLTRILQNSLGGNAKTVIICTITPATVEETLSTLKFATRAKTIRNKPQVNEDYSDKAELKRREKQIKILKQKLEAIKEEKDEEKKNMRKQIDSLTNMLVSRTENVNQKRSARRETWHGHAKFKVPLLPLKKSLTDEESLESSFSKIINLDNSLFPVKEPSRRNGSMWSNQQCKGPMYCDLSTVDEECEIGAFDGTFSRTSKQSSVHFSGVTSHSETGVQTDNSSVENGMYSEEQVMNLKTMIRTLGAELAELKEFTSLEKQCYDENRIKKPGNETSQHNVLRFSLSDKNADFLSFNKQSSTPLKHSPLNTKDSTIDLVGCEKDRLFEYLNDTIKILGKCTLEGSVPMADNLNTQYQVFLNLFSMVLQHQCSKVKDNEYLSTKLSDTLEFLNRILSHFNDKSLLNEGMIEEFMNKTNDLLKEIEMFSLDFDDEKASTVNNVLLVDNTEANHCFDVSVRKPKLSLNFNQNSKVEISPAKTSTATQSVEPLMADAVINTSIDLLSLATHENPEVINLKSQIAVLEKDVAYHLKTISELQEDIELKNDELQLQNEIAECLKEELSAKDKEIDSYKMVQDTCTGEKLNCSSQTSYFEENDTNTEKLSLLDSELCKNTKIISDLEYEKDSKDKQIALCKDKIRIQEQIILSLQTEISLKTEESVSTKKPLYVNSSSQTFYLGDLSQDDHRNKEHEISVFEDTSLNDDQEAENYSKESPIKNTDTVVMERCCKGLSENCQSVDSLLKLGLKELMDLKQFAVEFMERHMDEVYFRSVCESDLSEEPVSVQDWIKVESNTLRKLLQRIEFYLKDKCESYEYFQDVLRDTSNEVVELKSQLADAESQLTQSKGEMQGLYEAFKDLESKASIFLKEFEAPKSLEWKDSISSDESSKTLKYASLLKKVNKMLKYFVEERKSLSSKASSTLERPENSCRKVSKAIQTVEDERLVQMSKKLDTLTAEKENLLIDISHLNSRIEKIKQFRDEAEGRFKDKESRYKTEIQSLKLMFESEKNIWTENASKCVQSVEEKYDQMINEQEVRFCDELNRVKDQLKELVAKHEKEITNLKKNHLEKMTDAQDKLSNALTAKFSEEIESEKAISNLKKDIASRTEMITKLKYKWKSCATELHKLKASAEKSTSEVGVQTSSALNEDKKRIVSGKEQTLNPNVVKKDFAVQTSAPELAEKTSDKAVAVLTCKNEALGKEIEDIKRDLSSKMMLLRSCRCRLVPPAPGKNKPTGEKSTELDKNTDQTGTKKAEKRGEMIFSSAAEVLQSDFVKKAIELEVEREIYKLSDSGTASTMVNCMLKKDLHSKDRNIAALKKEIAELKAYAKRRNALPVNENLPFPNSEDVTEYNRGNNPYPPGEVPRLQTKNMLKEKNQVPQINHPAGIKMKDKKDILCEKPVYSNANPSQAPCVKSNRNGKQTVEEFKRDWKQFESTEPECKQQ